MSIEEIVNAANKYADRMYAMTMRDLIHQQGKPADYAHGIARYVAEWSKAAYMQGYVDCRKEES